jgi:hypothetical protein
MARLRLNFFRRDSEHVNTKRPSSAKLNDVVGLVPTGCFDPELSRIGDKIEEADASDRLTLCDV